LRTTDGGEIVEELVQRMVPFEVIEHRVHRNPRSDEDRFTAHDLRVAMDDWVRALLDSGR
jgi:hypothetical protein